MQISPPAGLRLRWKLLVVAILPLLGALSLVAVALRIQERELALRQEQLVRAIYKQSTEAELRHYVALALSAISPLYNTGRDDPEIRQQAMRQLAQMDYGPDGYFFLYDLDGTNLMHPRQPELVGKNLMDMRDADGQPAIRELIERARSGGGFVRYSWNKPSTHAPAPKLAYVTSLDRWHWMLGTGIYVDDVDDVLGQLNQQLRSNVADTMRWIAVTAVAAIAIIVATALLLGLSEKRAADAKLTLLTRQVVRSQEEERVWLSRELHDGTSQMLASVKLLAESALARLPAEESSARPMLTRALARLNGVIADVRRISHQLRPTALDTLGLCTALRNLGEEMCHPAGMVFDMSACQDTDNLPQEIRTTLFRVSQEAMTNAVRHAQASRVSVRLDHDADGLRLTIEDNGQGFDLQAVAQHPRRGIGLRNMRERLESIGGSLRIQSRPQQTQVIAEVPTQAIRSLASRS